MRCVCFALVQNYDHFVFMFTRTILQFKCWLFLMAHARVQLRFASNIIWARVDKCKHKPQYEMTATKQQPALYEFIANIYGWNHLLADVLPNLRAWMYIDARAWVLKVEMFILVRAIVCTRRCTRGGGKCAVFICNYF